jgi:hypothetical protein
MAKRKTKKEQATPRANWGARETRRNCPKCAGVISEVLNTRQHFNPARTWRRRKCECGQVYTTIEPLE